MTGEYVGPFHHPDGAEFFVRPEAVTHIGRYPGQLIETGVGDEIRIFIGSSGLVVTEPLARVLTLLKVGP